MTARVLYKSSVGRDLKRLTPQDRDRVLRQIRANLSAEPLRGDALHGEFEGLYKLWVGECRVVYALVGRDVLVLRIRHRAKAHD